MGVQQTIMALGDWSVQLRDDTPLTVRQAVATPFQHVVITRQPLDALAVPDAAILAGALFTGVVLDPGPQLTLGGVDLGWWLGDSSGNGPGVIDPAISFNLAPFETVMPALLPSSIAAGDIQVYGLQHVATYQYVSRREAIDTACKAFGGLEWRINPFFTFDAGTADFLYGSTPTAVAVRGGGEDLVLTGVDGAVNYSSSWDTYASRVLLFSRAGPVQTGGASPYRDGRGNMVTVTKMVQANDVAPGGETNAAAAELSKATPHEEISIDTDDYAVSGKINLGSRIWIYDPVIGLFDASNQVQYQGRTIFPTSRRVFGMRWPVTQGMGVYYRTHNGTAASYTDLTPYVEWETGSTQIDVGWVPRSLVGAG